MRSYNSIDICKEFEDNIRKAIYLWLDYKIDDWKIKMKYHEI